MSTVPLQLFPRPDAEGVKLRSRPVPHNFVPFDIYFSDLNKLYLNLSWQIIHASKEYDAQKGDKKELVEIPTVFYDPEWSKPFVFKLYFLRDQKETPGLRLEITKSGINKRFSGPQIRDISKYDFALIDHKTGKVSDLKKLKLPKDGDSISNVERVDLFLLSCAYNVHDSLPALSDELLARKAEDYKEEYEDEKFAFSIVIIRDGKLVTV